VLLAWIVNTNYDKFGELSIKVLLDIVGLMFGSHAIKDGVLDSQLKRINLEYYRELGYNTELGSEMYR